MVGGTPYPHPSPAAGSNAIGDFVIGISPIGTISSFDPWQTVLSQYGNSPVITSLIASFNAAVDETENLDDYYDDIFNVLTAQGYGLDLWGRVVGVSRVVAIPGSAEYLGFEEAASWVAFGQGVFWSGSTVTNNVVLSDAAFRTLILAKAASNICDGSIPAINAILLALFPNRGSCYVTDLGNMAMSYTFNFTLTPVELAIVETSGVLPTPAGVAATVVQL